MLKADLFEELLATYPAEKRELARQIYYRFAEGDSTQFFTQLFLLLDVYAHYAERVPQAVVEANQNAHVGLVKVREEIGLLAQMIEKRNVNITNQTDVTAELCQTTVAQCRDTIARVESALKNVGAQVDTQTIVAGVQEALKAGIQKDVIGPFLLRSKEMTNEVSPTLREIRENVAKASQLWPQRIWRTALLSSLTIALSLTLFATLAIYAMFKNYSEDKVAEKIVAAEQVLDGNRQAFRELAIAGLPVKVIRTENNGTINPAGFAIVVEDPDAAETRTIGGHNYGLIFFTSNRKEQQLQQLRHAVEALSDAKQPQPGLSHSNNAPTQHGSELP